MRFRVPLLGDGTREKPMGASAPHYTMVDVDYAAGTCVIDIQADRLPLGLSAPADAVVQLDKAPQTVIDALARHFDTNYKELGSGRFRLLGR